MITAKAARTLSYKRGFREVNIGLDELNRHIETASDNGQVCVVLPNVIPEDKARMLQDYGFYVSIVLDNGYSRTLVSW